MDNNISTKEQVEKQPKKDINGMEFVSIANELMRFYEFPSNLNLNKLVRVEIYNPEWLFVRPSGAHLVVDNKGLTHYIPASFIHLAWEKKEGTEAAEF